MNHLGTQPLISLLFVRTKAQLIQFVIYMELAIQKVL
jgi:hypothetical protein